MSSVDDPILKNNDDDAVDHVRCAFPPSSHRRWPASPWTFWSRVRFSTAQFFAALVSGCCLCAVVSWACLKEVKLAFERMLNPQRRSVYKWDVLRPTKEKHTKDPGYYAREVGLDITDDIAETDDGYLLRMHTIVNIQQQRLPDGRGLAPVLLVPGLFQCSGCFITSEERSLAFWLSNQGYQIFMGNNRGVFGMGHREFSRSDPRFWGSPLRCILKPQNWRS
ncbi:hypothetical protein FRB93_007503 [Tulasnella sp. JGI-2019a]|nr:hypothetical protein FRB93_007503 [Tulasnella sp. JGI-2019a]